MLETLLEKLQLRDEKNLLIQGLPSSIEKQFVKLSFAKNLTPLLKSKKIDFALVFAVNEVQLQNIINEVLPAMRPEAKLWVAYPKLASKIATCLNRDYSWNCIRKAGYESCAEITIDHVWTAVCFGQIPEKVKQAAGNSILKTGLGRTIPIVSFDKSVTVHPPDDFAKELKRSKVANHFFEKLSVSDKEVYVSWITNAKKDQTRSRRLETAIDKLIAGKKSPTQV